MEEAKESSVTSKVIVLGKRVTRDDGENIKTIEGHLYSINDTIYYFKKKMEIYKFNYDIKQVINYSSSFSENMFLEIDWDLLQRFCAKNNLSLARGNEADNISDISLRYVRIDNYLPSQERYYCMIIDNSQNLQGDSNVSGYIFKDQEDYNEWCEFTHNENYGALNATIPLSIAKACGIQIDWKI
jgi:hypothetical protein